MKTTKETDFLTTVTKEIEDKRTSTAGLKDEITKLEQEIADLNEQINSFTDVNNVKAYSDLKDNMEVRQNKLEVLRRKYNTEAGELDDGHAAIILNGFLSEKRKIDDKYCYEMLEIIHKLEDKLEEADGKREGLKALYDTWVTTFKVNPTKYQSYPAHDETGVSAKVHTLINSLRFTGKIE